MKRLGITLFGMASMLAGCGEGESTGAGPTEPGTPRLVSANIANEAGVQSGWKSYHYDSAGRLIRVVTYGSKGADDLWGTGDDTVSRWSSCLLQGSGVAWRDLGVMYNSIPLNETVRAEWDALAPHEPECGVGVASFETLTENIYVANGSDGVWFTADDVPDVYRLRLDQGLAPSASLSWEATGEAGSDRVREYFYLPGDTSYISIREGVGSTWDFNATYLYGTLIPTRRLVQSGPDNTLHTEDDVTLASMTRLFSIDSSVIEKDYVEGVMTGYREYVSDGARLITLREATAAGLDEVWETDDDIMRITQYHYQ